MSLIMKPVVKVTKAEDAWNVNQSKLIDAISKESVTALDALSAYISKLERLVINAKAALMKAKQGGNALEIQWLSDAVREYEEDLRKARNLI